MPKVVGIKLTDCEYVEWQLAAERAGVSVTAWVRQCAQEAIGVNPSARKVNLKQVANRVAKEVFRATSDLRTTRKHHPRCECYICKPPRESK